MGSFFKNKFFITVLIIAIVLTATCVVAGLTGHAVLLENAVGIVFTPLQKGVDYFQNGLRGYVSYFTEYDTLKEENERLKRTLNEKTKTIEDAERLKAENEWLYGFYNLKSEREELSLLDAMIVSRSGGSLLTVFTLDKGTAHGVRLHCPVITADGVVGSITQIGTNWAKVESVINPDAGVSAVVARTGDIGVVEGDFTQSLEGKCLIKYLPEDSKIEIGDKIVTSGYGSVYPDGLVIGVIESFYPDPLSHSVFGVIKPSADLEGTNRVMVITSSEVVIE
ncbi:MAG: rod shape-determining protein MreC [Eubacteriales bacterium]